MEKRILETVEHNTVQLGRIAFALEEILRLVKEDQEQYKNLIDDVDLFMKHVFELTGLDKNLGNRISQVENFYGE